MTKQEIRILIDKIDKLLLRFEDERKARQRALKAIQEYLQSIA